MDAALAKQTDARRRIDNFWGNLLKVGKQNLTPSLLSTRLTLLDDYWSRFENGHYTLHELPEATSSKYFTEDVFSAVETSYVDTRTKLLDLIKPTDKPKLASQTASEPRSVELPRPVELPRINLPSFAGEPLAWEGFRDLFRALVHDVSEIPTVQKLHYLRTCLTGAAAACVANVETSEAGYTTAWDALTRRYDNKRVLMATHMRALLSAPAAARASSAEIHRLMSCVNQAARSFRAIGRPVSMWDDWFVHILVEKLDSESRLLWEASLSSSEDFPSLERLMEYLTTRARALDAAQPAVTTKFAPPTTDRGTRRRNVTALNVSLPTSPSTAARRCTICEGPHLFNYCLRFRSMNVEQRRALTRRNGACLNCLRSGHRAESCPSSQRCQRCQRLHHTLLHGPEAVAEGSTRDRTSDQPHAQPSSADQARSNLTVLHAATDRTVLLSTALVVVKGNEGEGVTVRALLDNGAEASFLSERVAQVLGLPRTRANVNVTSILDCSVGKVTSVAAATISAPGDPAWNLRVSRFLVAPKVTSVSPGSRVISRTWTHLQGLTLADPRYHHPAAVEAVLGADVYGQLLRGGVVRGPPDTPCAIQTVFGWVLTGPTASVSAVPGHPDEVTVHHAITTRELDRRLERFWAMEEVGSSHIPTPEETRCEEHFVSTHARDTTGRYVVRLPWRAEVGLALGDSRVAAANCLTSLERRFARQPTLRTRYAAFLEDYLAKGHMQKVTDGPGHNDHSNYLPHHAVVKKSDPSGKLRVVFNASFCTSSGLSLNDLLLPGPRLQSDLWVVLSRWRLFRFAFTADIVQMFRQIRLHPEDCDWQRILWRTDPSAAMESYRLTTVTYGTASAPFLALRTLRQLACDEREKFPLGATVLESHSYVDDLLAGADSLNDALEVQRQLTNILETGGFPLSKWASNHPLLCPEDEVGSRVFGDTEGCSTLGVLWNPVDDTFRLRAAPTFAIRSYQTKRTVLSDVARLFDPLGWAAPVLVTGKLFVQELWKSGVAWDEPLPPDQQEAWNTFAASLPVLQDIQMPRWVSYAPANGPVELHGFSDASSRAYAATVFLRQANADGFAKVNLLVAKTKVAPVRTHSIPRLELCGALLLARLLKAVVTELHLDEVPIFAWTDAEVVLAWLASHASRWKPFVANRIAAVQELVPANRWNHVSSEDNPADVATRGIAAAELASVRIWWTGPSWLSKPSTQWPAPRVIQETSNSEELRSTAVHIAHLSSENELLSRFSSLSRLLRISAWCLWFIRNTRKKKPRLTGFLSSSELDACRLRWLRLAQQQSFLIELQALTAGRPLPRKSPLLPLRPMLGDDGLLRVGGRLHHSLLPYDEKHPVILAKGGHLSLLLVRDAHECSLHGGPQLTRNILLRRYWIVHAGSLVRSVIHRCVRCARFRTTGPQQQMGQLPLDRVRSCRPFEAAGVDYAGPIQLRTTRGRGHKSYKGYICVFVCLATKAVHLEAVSDLSTRAFLDAFRRFVARRGPCRRLLSDNGTNFRGADTELRNMFAAASDFYREVSAVFANDGTKWTFIPPAAPHFGGLWEAGVKAVKFHLRRIIGERTLTYEEMCTLLCQIEACLNSRPLCQLSSDPDDPTPLTPGHFLVGEPLIGVPEPSRSDVPENHSLPRWAHISRMRDHFWRRWTSEYLHGLQHLPKWRDAARNLRLGTLVLVVDDLQPPTKWPLARVSQIHPGPDGLVRVVTVKMGARVLKRPITKIRALPVDSEL